MIDNEFENISFKESQDSVKRVCIPEKIKCSCVNSIKKVLEEIISTVNSMGIPGFSVNVIITTKTGLSYTVPFSAGVANPPTIDDSIIVIDKKAISICSIAKIQVVTSSLTSHVFKHKLLEALKKIALICKNFCNCSCDYVGVERCRCNNCINDINCAQDLQDYINKHIKHISTIAFDNTVENISGNIICAGNGIIVVENTNGNISIYSTCHIQAVTLV